MSLTNIIDNFPISTDLNLDTFNDNRVKIHLLYKENNDSMNVLITPFGVDLKTKQDFTNYIKILPNESVFCPPLSDVKLEEVFLKDKSKYIILNTDEIRAVLPFKIHKDVLPYKIMPNSFAKLMEECYEKILKKTLHFSESLYDALESNKVEEIFKFISKAKEIHKELYEIYKPLRQNIVDAFKNEDSPSKKMGRFERKIKHFFLKDYEKYIHGRNKYQKMSAIKNQLFIAPFKHIVFCTEENKNFIFSGKNEKEMKKFRILSDYLKTESPKSLELFKKISHLEQKAASSLYHSYLMAICGVSLMTGHPWNSAAFFGLFLMEYFISSNNEKKFGFNTSIIGTLRDKLGLARKIDSPFYSISDDYDLGKWKPEE